MGLEEFTSLEKDETKNTPSDWGVEGPLVSRCYAFSIRQDNWRNCVDPEPSYMENAGEIDEPTWQGVGANAKTDPRSLAPGTLVVARRASRGGNQPHGAKGLWRYRSYERVTNQDDVPWSDDCYDWVLYCEPIQREFPNAVDERMNDLPFYQTKFMGAVNELRGQDCKSYLARLLDSGLLNQEAESAVRGRKD